MFYSCFFSFKLFKNEKIRHMLLKPLLSLNKNSVTIAFFSVTSSLSVGITGFLLLRGVPKMTSRELIAFLRENGISIELRGGKMSAVPKEKAAPLAKELAKHRRVLFRRAAGGFVDWQGILRPVRDECKERHCATCKEWQPEFDDDHELTGLCVARLRAEIKLSGEMLRGKGECRHD